MTVRKPDSDFSEIPTSARLMTRAGDSTSSSPAEHRPRLPPGPRGCRDVTAPEDLEIRCTEAALLLEGIVADRGLLSAIDPALKRRLLEAAGRVSRPERDEQKRLNRVHRRLRQVEKREKREQFLAETGIRQLRNEAVFPVLPKQGTPSGEQVAGPAGQAHELPHPGPERDLAEARNCYICKQDFTRMHGFYDAMCPSCAEFNWSKRFQAADLDGRVAVITGARVKIGYQAGLKLLRAGAHVVVTTRFPRDAAQRYAQEGDFEQFSSRLEIYGLDLRHTPSVEAFCRHMLDRYGRLDYILNNACQTVRRPPGFYGHLMELESQPLGSLPAATQAPLRDFERLRAAHRQQAESTTLAAGGTGQEAAGGAAVVAPQHGGPLLSGLHASASLSQIPLIEGDLEAGNRLFPVGELDADMQQVDLRGINSWRLGLADVSSVELLEVQLVNAVAPFVLNARLKPLMMRTENRDKHIVNVSAMEGQFYRAFKTDKHPHTNMAKAALNMMTRTSAPDYLQAGIHMNAVDTGWITDEDPADTATRKREVHGFHPPLDIIDAAARICAPIFDGLLTGEHDSGLFLKDYKPARW